MRRFWLEANAKSGDRFEISGEKFKHIVGVCRMGIGSKFELILGDDQAYFVEIIELEKKAAYAKLIDVRTMTAVPRPFIHLYLSLPKISRFEWIVEKSVELGVKSVVPLFSDFSFVKKQDYVAHKKTRWDKIIESASQQSGRSEKMLLEDPIPLDAALKRINRNANFMGLFAYEGESKLGLKKALQAKEFQQAQDIALFVGSEGGFSDLELQSFINNGMEPVSLGEQVLRVETACVTLISVLKYELELFY